MMKKTLSLFFSLALISGAAFASDVTQKAGGHTVLKTNHDAGCSTPSGRTSRNCAHAGGAQAKNH